MILNPFPAQLPPAFDEAATLVKLLDLERKPLRLERFTADTEVRILEEQLPGVKPLGNVQSVAGTGVRVGSRLSGVLSASVYGLVVGVWTSGGHQQLRDVLSEVQYHLSQAGYARSGTRLYEFASVGEIQPAWRGSAALGGTVTAKWEVSRPYQLGPVRSMDVPVGMAFAVPINGHATCDLRVEITAGSADVHNPNIESASGTTTFWDTVPAGQTLVIDATLGEWRVELQGVNHDTDLYGPQPALTPKENIVTITAPGATARVIWQEGFL